MYDCTGKSAVSRMLSQEDNVTALLPFVEPKGWNFSTLSSSLSFLLLLSLLPALPLSPSCSSLPLCSSSLSSLLLLSSFLLLLSLLSAPPLSPLCSFSLSFLLLSSFLTQVHVPWPHSQALVCVRAWE